ncbi:sulfite exporter TauE/SafE family protein [Paenalcaligenes hominis]|uniref:sulfite exporter TauE/SafE family protein n=1 Tax=Paenalcaligenes hominis TaxID=643674 RepID=UPI0035258965
MSLLFIFLLALLGTFVGFAAGLLGIGGGMILVPFLNLLLPLLGVPAEIAVHVAIATAMATIIFTSLSSVKAHQAHGAIRWDVVKLMVPGLLIGGLLSGGAVFAYINGLVLAIIFALFVVYSALKMFKNSPPPVGVGLPAPWKVTGFGGVVGFISGLLGAGGGFLSVPFLVRANISMPKAIATSAALGFFIAIANGVGYVWAGSQYTDIAQGLIGFVYWPALVVLTVCSMVSAPFGARMAHRLPVKTLKRLFATMLLILAVQMLFETLRVHLGL